MYGNDITYTYLQLGFCAHTDLFLLSRLGKHCFRKNDVIILIEINFIVKTVFLIMRISIPAARRAKISRNSLVIISGNLFERNLTGHTRRAIGLRNHR